ncbi:MAG: hypothetical protein ACP5SH_02935 [Syntrophobacteraceae bacterium]
MTSERCCQVRKEVADASDENHFAGIDIGSHTTRLLIARRSGNELVAVRAERRVTRLAEGFERSGSITEEAQQRNLTALKEYAAILRDYRVEKVSCGATGVVRRAKNSDETLARIESETGLVCSILSEESEANLSAKGILSVIRLGGEHPVLFDVGGGSTEFVLPIEKDGTRCASRPIGAATLTQAYLAADPPGMEAVERAALAAREQIETAKEQLYENLHKKGKMQNSGGVLLAGTAGTVTTLAAMRLEMTRYLPYRVNGLVLPLEWIDATIRSFASMELCERRKVAGLEAGREDIILAGAVIVSQILSSFGCDRFTVSDAGLLEGIVIDSIERESGLEGTAAGGPKTRLTWRLAER